MSSRSKEATIRSYESYLAATEAQIAKAREKMNEYAAKAKRSERFAERYERARIKADFYQMRAERLRGVIADLAVDVTESDIDTGIG